MLTKNQQLWVDALRSGEYNQTKECLQDMYGHCCLGVACEVYEKETRDSLLRDIDGYLFGDSLYDQKLVREWIQLQSDNGELEGHPYSNSLVVLNDNGILDFNQLADYIEENQDKLFCNKGVINYVFTKLERCVL